MNRIASAFKALWCAIKPDAASMTASAMRFEGYTDFEIAQEVRAIRERTAANTSEKKDSAQ